MSAEILLWVVPRLSSSTPLKERAKCVFMTAARRGNTEALDWCVGTGRGQGGLQLSKHDLRRMAKQVSVTRIFPEVTVSQLIMGCRPVAKASETKCFPGWKPTLPATE